jgi:hypothetical protein
MMAVNGAAVTVKSFCRPRSGAGSASKSLSGMPLQVDFDDDDPNSPDNSPPDEDEFEDDPPPTEELGAWRHDGRIGWCLGVERKRSLAKKSRLEDTIDDNDDFSTARHAVFIHLHSQLVDQ